MGSTLFRWSIYPILFIIVMTFTSPVTWNIIPNNIPNLNYLFLQTYPDSARYMLSTIVQSEAAIFALIVSLSLVAVQLSASSFSSRIIEIFKKSPDVWTLILIYIFLIIYGVAILKLIEPNEEIISDFEYYISLDYRLGVFAFLALIPYIWNILDLLKPSNIIDKLSEKITKERILSIDRFGDKNDAIQPITDIIISSLMRYDESTVIYGLNAIGSKLELIFTEFDKCDVCNVSIVFRHLSIIGELAVEKRDAYATVHAIVTIGQIGMLATEEMLEEVSLQSILSIGEIGTRSNRQNMEYVSIWAVNLLGKIGVLATNKMFQNNCALQAILFTKDIGATAAETSRKVSIKHATSSIRSIGMEGSKRRQKDTVLIAVSELEKLGVISIESGLENEAIAAAESLEAITIIAIENNLESEAVFAARAIGNLGTIAAKKEFKEMISNILLYLKKIGENSIDRRSEKTASIAIIGLGSVGIASAKQKLCKATDQSISQIKFLQILAKENKLDDISSLGEKSINNIYSSIDFKKDDINIESGI